MTAYAITRPTVPGSMILNEQRYDRREAGDQDNERPNELLQNKQFRVYRVALKI